MNICRKKHVADADAALVEVFINSHFVNNTLIMKCVILICTVETLSMRRVNAGFHHVCQIKFSQVYFRLTVDMVFALYYITSLMCVWLEKNYFIVLDIEINYLLNGPGSINKR